MRLARTRQGVKGIGWAGTCDNPVASSAEYGSVAAYCNYPNWQLNYPGASPAGPSSSDTTPPPGSTPISQLPQNLQDQLSTIPYVQQLPQPVETVVPTVQPIAAAPAVPAAAASSATNIVTLPSPGYANSFGQPPNGLPTTPVKRTSSLPRLNAPTRPITTPVAATVTTATTPAPAQSVTAPITATVSPSAYQNVGSALGYSAATIQSYFAGFLSYLSQQGFDPATASAATIQTQWTAYSNNTNGGGVVGDFGIGTQLSTSDVSGTVTATASPVLWAAAAGIALLFIMKRSK